MVHNEVQRKKSGPVALATLEAASLATNATATDAAAAALLSLVDDVERLLRTSPHHLFGRWLQDAEAAADGVPHIMSRLAPGGAESGSATPSSAALSKSTGVATRNGSRGRS